MSWLDRRRRLADAAHRQVGSPRGGPSAGGGAQRRDAVARSPSSPATDRSGSAGWERRRRPGSTLVTVSGAVRVTRGGTRSNWGPRCTTSCAEPGSTPRCPRCCSEATAEPGSIPAFWPRPSPRAPLAAAGATLGVGIVIALPVGIVRDRRDGPDRPLHGRRECRPVRPLRLRPSRRRRRSRAVGRPVGPTPGCSTGSHPGVGHRGTRRLPSPRRRGPAGAQCPGRLRRRRPGPCRRAAPVRGTPRRP